MTLDIGMVAGEPSGDLIASRVMAGLSAQTPDAVFQGIGGPAMEAAGFKPWYPMHALTVFGYVDALKRLPQLIRTYRSVRSRWLANRPDVFVGIDAPDFNLRLERELRAAGVPTVHFVGPSIWAWRYERIHAIRDAVSHMLVLFPFEVELYERENIPVTYVGHPLADQIPLTPDRDGVRARLGLAPDDVVLTVMPGSRSSEINALAPRFLETAQLLQRQIPNLKLLVPMVNAQRRAQFCDVLARYPVQNLTILDKASVADRPAAWDALEAADAVLVASGTATLEAALFKRPMVISYVLSPLMRRIMAWKSGQEKPYVPWVGLPNVLLKDFVVPELLQDDAQPKKLAQACLKALTDSAYVAQIQNQFQALHHTLRCNTPQRAAQAILQVIETHAS